MQNRNASVMQVRKSKWRSARLCVSLIHKSTSENEMRWNFLCIKRCAEKWNNYRTKEVNGEKKKRKKCLVIPGISFSKLQLQSVVDLIMSVSISDMQNVFTWQKEKGVTASVHKAQLSICDANPIVPSFPQHLWGQMWRCGRPISRVDMRTLKHG